MDNVKLAQTSELVTRRHSRWSTSSWTLRMVYHPIPNQDSRVGRHLLFHDRIGNHRRSVPSISPFELD